MVGVQNVRGAKSLPRDSGTQTESVNETLYSSQMTRRLKNFVGLAQTKNTLGKILRVSLLSFILPLALEYD